MTILIRNKLHIVFFVALVFLGWMNVVAQPALRSDGKTIVYTPDSLGNKIPDFSYAGYKASNESIPSVEARIFISWKEGDQTERIQRAIDFVARLPLNNEGFRGAILLDKGVFEVLGGLTIKNSGVVLRGSGIGETTLLGAGLDRETLIRVYGVDDRVLSEPVEISSEYVPVGAMRFEISDASEIKVGEETQITRPSTEEWIEALGMKDFGGETGYIGWKKGERDIVWNRTITAIDGNQITVDAPITTALDKKYGGGLVQKVDWPGRIQNVGVENLTLKSTYDESNPKDEQHRWMAITMESVRDAWVRQADFRNFAGSAVAIWNTGSRVNVEDCRSFEPVSEIGGQRRYTFYTEGQQCLFQRIYSEYGYHDFGVGFMAAGPNAFVECQAYLPHSFSGTIDSWASGVLFDIVNVDGQAIRFGNRSMEAQGAGWTAANSMIWQSTAARVDCPAPPTAANWAYAIWAQFSGNGQWYEPNSFLKPRSLFCGQLSQRLKKEVNGYLPMNTSATSSPTLDQAEQYVAQSKESRPQLKDWIASASKRNPIPRDKKKVKSVDKIALAKPLIATLNKELSLKNGRLVFGEELAMGNRMTVQWWRGNVRDYDAKRERPHVTRYVPGRIGQGHTDDLDEAVKVLSEKNVTVLDHNYGLWYDRRRDDHERVRRMNGEVWAPFYELPFARSGKGTAWDGLSKYDLTKYNYWYWNRLGEFAEKADQKGLVLYHQNYFQHNILEAGAHYADFPWRTANNINNTPFQEPVNYAGDKRIFIADQFYDVSNPEYRKLHEAYIRKCLDNFEDNTNVIQFISAEYTGPLSFVEFWLDVIAEWQKETGKDALVALSTTKDVQDAILADPKRSALIDVIDIRYWWYGQAKDGSDELYAPEGGKNLAPRQHARLTKTPNETFELTYRAVKEYKETYPEKAVIYNTQRSSAFGWAVFMAGGSLMNVPKPGDPDFLNDASCMTPERQTDELYGLLNEGNGEQILFARNAVKIPLDLSAYSRRYELKWMDPKNGLVLKTEVVEGNQKFDLSLEKDQILWVDLGDD